MWGDAKGAGSIGPSDPLAKALLHVTGPTHVPLNDPSWQSLLLHYDRLVHIDRPSFDKNGTDNNNNTKNNISSSNNNNNNNNNNNHGDGAKEANNEESENSTSFSVIRSACHLAARHSLSTSNLAALTLHTARMVKDLDLSVHSQFTHSAKEDSQKNGGADSSQLPPVSIKIVLIGKARATCGALNLLRILSHAVLVDSYSSHKQHVDSTDENGTSAEYNPSSSSPLPPSHALRNIFTHRTQDKGRSARAGGHSRERDAAKELQSSILSFLTTMGNTSTTYSNGPSSATSGLQNHTNEITSNSPSALINSVPELYDAVVLSLSLELVLLSTQLYQPMISTLQQLEASSMTPNFPNAKGQIHSNGTNYFLDQLMQDANLNRQERQRQKRAGGGGKDGIDVSNQTPSRRRERQGGGRDGSIEGSWTSQTVLSSCLNWIIERPVPPPRSISAHYISLAESLLQFTRHKKVGDDGMYEDHAIVMSRAPRKNIQRGGQLTTAGTSGTVDSVGGNNNAAGLRGRKTASTFGQPISPLDAPMTDDDDVDTNGPTRRSSSSQIVSATKDVLTLSSEILLLPLRLLSLALSLLGARHNRLLGPSDFGKLNLDMIMRNRGGSILSSSRQLRDEHKNNIMRRRTNDVLWLTDSPIADLGSSLFLILANNYRVNEPSQKDGGAGKKPVATANFTVVNAFRSELKSLNDNRWEGRGTSINLTSPPSSPAVNDGASGISLMPLSGGRMGEGDNGIETRKAATTNTIQTAPKTLSLNFELLFESFGQTLHTELGGLMLYTLLQSSPMFAASVAVRSDLDTLVMPLLRTLYFSSSVPMQHLGQSILAGTSNGRGPDNVPSMSSKRDLSSKLPFRSQSQLYVILILLLLFSQDPSFGPDSFRRVRISSVSWYKERHLRDISLGSVLLLTLLRCVTFDLNRLHDAFLLSNCCAVLLNLSPHVVKLHSYAGMRLASVTAACLKKYTIMVMRNGGRAPPEGDLSSLLGMYRETCRTLLQVLRHSLEPKSMGKNLHLVYALVYMQTDYKSVASSSHCPFAPSDIGPIMSVIEKADEIIRGHGPTSTAEQAMNALQDSIETLRATAGLVQNTKTPGNDSKENIHRENSSESLADMSFADSAHFTFTYEEEADPEVFFIPYVWEVIVCAVTASSLEWDKDKIQVFPLLEEEVEEGASDERTIETPKYSENASDMV